MKRPRVAALLGQPMPSGNNQTRLTPLVALHSGGGTDTFYTTAPQMGSAALTGSLQRVQPGTPWWTR
jgi:hypothetical protein